MSTMPVTVVPIYDSDDDSVGTTVVGKKVKRMPHPLPPSSSASSSSPSHRRSSRSVRSSSRTTKRGASKAARSSRNRGGGSSGDAPLGGGGGGGGGATASSVGLARAAHKRRSWHAAERSYRLVVSDVEGYAAAAGAPASSSDVRTTKSDEGPDRTGDDSSAAWPEDRSSLLSEPEAPAFLSSLQIGARDGAEAGFGGGPGHDARGLSSVGIEGGWEERRRGGDPSSSPLQDRGGAPPPSTKDRIKNLLPWNRRRARAEAAAAAAASEVGYVNPMHAAGGGVGGGGVGRELEVSDLFFSSTQPKRYESAVEDIANKIDEELANGGPDYQDRGRGGGAYQFPPSDSAGNDDAHRASVESIDIEGEEDDDGGGGVDVVGMERRGLGGAGRSGSSRRVERRPSERSGYDAFLDLVNCEKRQVEEQERNKRRQQRLCGALAVLVCLGVAVGCSAALARAGPEARARPPAPGEGAGDAEGGAGAEGEPDRRPAPPRPAPPAPPGPSTREDPPDPRGSVTLTRDDLVPLLTPVTPLSILEDGTAPQGKALDWMLRDAPFLSAPADIGGGGGDDDKGGRLKLDEMGRMRIKQRYVLASLYHSLSGDGWENAEHWMTSHHECDWAGVKCGHDRHGEPPQVRADDVEGANGAELSLEYREVLLENAVTYLDLHSSNLEGRLPPEIGALSHLSQLRLHDNAIGGSIPDALLDLGNLHTLFLDKNRMTGTIPGDVGRLAKMENLDLSSNSFGGAVPNGVGNMDALVDLRLGSNRLTGEFPLEVVDLERLETLLLENNSIGGTIPGALGRLRDLVAVRLQGNELFGTIPPFESPMLEELHLDDNAFDGPIPDMLGSSSMRELRLERNRLVGPIPEAIGARMTGLEVLELEHNSFAGPIPTNLGSLVQLERVRLEGNALTGTVPPELCELGLDALSADCDGPTPEVECSCCTDCFR